MSVIHKNKHKSMVSNRRGFSSIVGAIFAILIIVSLMSTFFVWSLSQNSLYNNEVATKNQLAIDQTNESLNITKGPSYAISYANKIVTVTFGIQNDGPVSVNVTTLWLQGVNGNGIKVYNSTLLNNGNGYLLTPGSVSDSLSQTLYFTNLDSNFYANNFTGWLITQRGRTFMLCPAYQQGSGTTIINNSTQTALVAQGLGSISVDSTKFFQYHPINSNNGTPIGLSSGNLTVPLKLTIFSLVFTNYDPTNQTIYLSPDSYLWVPCMKSGGIQSVYWGLMNITNNRIIVSPASYVPLPYGVPTEVYFGWSWDFGGNTFTSQIVDNGLGGYDISNKTLGLNAVLFGKIETAQGQIDFGQILPFKALKFLTDAIFPVIAITNPPSATGMVGTTVTVSGSGFAPNSVLHATVHGVSVSISGTTSSNTNGEFTGTNFTIPASTIGEQRITISDSSGNSAYATFTVTPAPIIPITVSSSPAGSGYITVDGIPITTPQTYDWVQGESHNIAAVSPVSGGTGTQYVYTSWSDSGTQSHNITVPATTTTYTATYKTQYQVSFIVTPSGSGTTSPSSTTWLDSGANAISATANSGYRFSAWSASGSISIPNPLTANPTTATITGQGTITATFAKQVIFVSAGTGSGVTANPTPTYPSNSQANDLILLQVTVRDTTNTPTTPAGFTLLYGPDSTGTGRQWIYYKFATGSESGSLTVTIGGSTAKLARMYAFRNVALSTFAENKVFGFATSATISGQTVSTTSDGGLAVSLVFVNEANAVDPFTGETGGNWIEPVSEFTTTVGSHGCIQLQTADMNIAGTISGGNYVMGSSKPWGVTAFALKPAP